MIYDSIAYSLFRFPTPSPLAIHMALAPLAVLNTPFDLFLGTVNGVLFWIRDLIADRFITSLRAAPWGWTRLVRVYNARYNQRELQKLSYWVLFISRGSIVWHVVFRG